MELINHTGIPAELTCSALSEADGVRLRTGLLVAKATFRSGAHGEMELDFETPDPLLSAEIQTALGMLPRDDLPRLPGQDGVDVMVLGHACAPDDTPVAEMTVSLDVSDRRFELRVTGDRVWVSGPDGERHLSAPTSFRRMPLTWERAFGGTVEVWLDENTVVPVRHALNPLGRGFTSADATSSMHARSLCPAGFPRAESQPAVAPNVESPRELVAEGAPSPQPTCWAPMPLELGFHASDAPPSEQPRTSFAVPELRGLPIGAGARVAMTGVDGAEWSFSVPDLRLAMDYVLGQRTGTLDLSMTQLLLFPDERRLTITAQRLFKFRVKDESTDRSARLSLGV